MDIKAAIKKQQDILAQARAEKRDLTDAEEKEFNDLQVIVDGDKSNTAAQKAVAGERKRVSDISALCRDFNVDPTDYISKGSSVDDVRAAILDDMKKNNMPSSVRVTADSGDKFRAAAAEALLMRSGSEISKPTEGAKELRGLSLKELAIEALESEGISNARRMSAQDVFDTVSRSFFNPTAAFPAILDTAINKKIVEAYNKTPTTFDKWTTKGSLSDFKESKDHEYIIGGGGDFLEVSENGELKSDTPATATFPTRQLKTFGRQFSMTRQAFVNDDIDFLAKLPGLYASKAKRTIDKQVYQTLMSANKIFDGKTLFDKSHNNVLDAGSAPSSASIQQMILKMQHQKDPFGEAITVVPANVIVPVGYEFVLATIFGSTNLPGTSNNDINPLYNYPVGVVQTPVLNELAGSAAAPWFLSADPFTANSIQVDYLNGNEIPILRRSEKAGILGFVWDIYLDWGINVRDFRGLVKNPGVVIK